MPSCSLKTPVAITWYDAVASTGWDDIEQDYPPHQIKSIGFLVYDSETHIIIAGSLGENDEATETNNRMTIPKGWIVSLVPLKI